MKQTAVEWYEIEIDSLFKKYEEKEISYREFITRKHNLFYQAKVLEKQQIIEACYFAYNEGCSYMADGKTEFESFEQYYDETFTKPARIANDNINVTNK